MKSTNFSVCIIITLISIPSTCFAYLDMGTGSLLIQGLMGAAVGGIVIARSYWHKIVCLFTGRKQVSKIDDDSSKNNTDHSKQEDAP